jgi:hypothetical protein
VIKEALNKFRLSNGDYELFNNPVTKAPAYMKNECGFSKASPRIPLEEILRIKKN